MLREKALLSLGCPPRTARPCTDFLYALPRPLHPPSTSVQSEIFITHATIDSNWRGLCVKDQSYVSVAGLWAASSDQDNVWISPDSKCVRARPAPAAQ